MSKKLSIEVTNTGEFIRRPSSYRNWITSDGPFKPEAGRYHLYVSLACPWAHRTLIVRKLKGLEAVFPYTVVDWFMDGRGWVFTDEKPKCSLDTVNNCSNLKDVYLLADPDYSGRHTVPVLWDKQNMTIVNNESSDIIRMMNSEFNDFCTTAEQRELNLYPAHLQAEIDEVNSWVYPNINNGVYRSGFATMQAAYNEAVEPLFNALNKAEAILSTKRYLTGDSLTEADICLFTTLIRFDAVYVGHFKCNIRRLVDYPNLWAYTRELYQLPGVAETVDFQHIKHHYYESHSSVNPTGVVPKGPVIDLSEPHGRGEPL